MWNYGFGWWFFPFFPLVFILFWGLIIFLFWRSGRWGRRSHWHREKSAEEVLAERFARSEINEDDYKKRMDVLRKHSGSA